MRHIKAALIAGLVLALAACGSPGQEGDGVASLGGPAASDGTASEAAAADPQAAMLEFAQCMRDNGVDMPDPQIDEDGGISVRAGSGPDELPDLGAIETAQEACGDLMAGAIADNPIQMDEAEQQALLDFAECMREEGLDWPDPQFDGGQVRVHMPEALDREAVEAAQEVCSELLGDGPMFGTTGSTGVGEGS